MKSWWRSLSAKALAGLFLVAAPVAWGGCYEEAGRKYNIDPLLLKAIAVTESGENPGAISPVNRNKTVDLGLMQVSSFWLDKITAYGIRKEDLFHPCQNVHVGAWILAQAIQLMGNNWSAVGAYNAGPGKGPTRDELRRKYAAKVWNNYMKLVSQR